MKLVQINSKIKNKISILSALREKEISLRGKYTSFYKDGKNKLKHNKFKGWINLKKAPKNILFAEVQSKIDGDETKLLGSFIGYLTRHFEDLIDSITIYYR